MSTITRGSRVTWKRGSTAWVAFGTVTQIIRNTHGERLARVLWDGDAESYVAHTTELVEAGE